MSANSDKQFIALMSAKTMIDNGMAQIEIRKLFGNKLGAKVCATVELDKRFPNLGIIGSFAKNREKDFAAFYASDLYELNRFSDLARWQEENEKRQIQGKLPYVKIDEKTIKEYFRLP